MDYNVLQQWDWRFDNFRMQTRNNSFGTELKGVRAEQLVANFSKRLSVLMNRDRGISSWLIVNVALTDFGNGLLDILSLLLGLNYLD